MAPRDGTDPASEQTQVPLEGDGHELIGRVIDGRYRLDATLGRGGMGLVYRASHVGLRRNVAVKILHPSLAASPEVRNRFEREALAVGKIDHPNCVSVYDVGRLPDGSLYLAMELLEGRPLADVLEQEGQIAPGRALHILAGILRGLAHIHAAGLVHRDIKPENIFLIRQGADEDFAKILDFGIAKGMDRSELDDGVKLTQAGMAFGTPIYMAPEQALGNPMDGRADLYAASVLAFEMLTGQPPFYSDDKLEVMSMHTARPVPPMRQRLIKGGKPIPSSLERLVVRGLTKKPSDRWPSAEVYLAEVEEMLRTPEGGKTDVSFDKPSSTGSHPLISEDGQIHITGATDFVVAPEPVESIADAIDDTLSATPPTPTVPAPAPVAADAVVRPQFRRQESPRSVGGVGLGLPYTGPGGEPIFGLTPEQRLASAKLGEPAFTAASSAGLSGVANTLEPDTTPMPRRRRPRRVVLYGAIAAAAIGIGVAIAVATMPHGGGGLDPSTPAGAAAAALDRGDPAEAVKLLEAQKAAIAQDPQAQLVLGHAHSARHESMPSLAAYELALALEPDLEADATLRANLRAMAADRDAAVVERALGLWMHTEDAEAKPALLKAAVSEDLDQRHAAHPVIERAKLGGSVDWLMAYSLDLEQESTCERRKDAVAKLRALGDSRAVPALERAVIRKGKTGAWKGKPVNACLADDAKAAIGVLRGLPKK